MSRRMAQAELIIALVEVLFTTNAGKATNMESLCRQIILPEINPPSPRYPQAQRVVNNYDR